MRHSCTLALLLALPLTGQTTWIVDANGGPGASFTDIQPAVDAAADGDRILVRDGSYTPFTIDGKGLAVLGTANVTVGGSGAVHVANLGPGQDVVLSDLLILAQATIFTVHGADNCAARLLMERVTFAVGANRVQLQDCTDLRLSEFRSGGGLTIARSTATLTDSQITAGPLLLFPPPALGLASANVSASRCAIGGQSQFNRAGPSSAVFLDAASVLMLTDDGSHPIGAGGSLIGPLPGIDGFGTVVRDPRVTIAGSSGGPPLAPGVREVVRPIPCLTVRSMPTRSVVELELSGAAGEAYAVLFGLPAPPYSLPGIGGTIGIGAPLASFAGVFGSSSVQRSYGLGGGLPPGFQLCWQAIASDATHGWHVSTAATYARSR